LLMFANGAGSSRAVLLCAVARSSRAIYEKRLRFSAAISSFGATRQRLVKVNEP
jgi:hypothetical protein